MDALRLLQPSNRTKQWFKLMRNAYITKICSPKIRNFSQQMWIKKLELKKAEDFPRIPAYRVMDEQGTIIDETQDPQLEDSLLVGIYKKMIELNIIEKILYESQRQGRISFFMTSFGEEATQFGSATALNNRDLIYGQYRETGVLLWRGFTAENIVDQCYGNDNDVAKGKQMPIHYGSKSLHFVTISSPLSTQMPQAVGSAYAYKRAKEGLCVAVYFGEGAASEGDAHAAFNFAAVLEAPVIFICRNNGYAISTPVNEQYSGDGIAAKGPAYGIATIRVDGNDLLAVYNATKAARQYAVDNNRPVLIETLTYRISHHSTSDDSTAYRSEEEVKQWQEQKHPVSRFKKYLTNKNLWNNKLQEEYEKEMRNKVLNAIKSAESTVKPAWSELFQDVYCEVPNSLQNQKKYLGQHIQKYAEHYPLKAHKNC